MAKDGQFSWDFGPISETILDCGHIYDPNGRFWGFTSRPHIGDVVMTLFLRLDPPFMTGDGQKWSILDQKWLKMAGLSTLQSGTKMVNITVSTIWDHFWPIWTLLDHFKQELIFCSEAPLQNPILSIWGKKSFLSEMVQSGLDGLNRVSKGQKN